MSISYAAIRKWNAAEVGQAGECIKASVRRLERAAETMADQNFPSGWEGRGATAAAVTRNRLVHFLQIQARIRDVFARQVFAAEAEITVLELMIELLDSEAKAQDFLIATDGTITDEHDYGFPLPDDLAVWIQRRAKMEDLADKRDDLLERAVQIDARLVEAAATAADNDDPDPGGLPNQEVQDDWAALTDAERREVLRNIAAELAERYGVSVYSITFANLDDNTLGEHDPTTHEITINTDYLDDPAVLNTIVHEMMHAGHDARPDDFPGLTPQELEELRDNEGNYNGYNDASDDWEDYRYQPEEDTTRREADEWVENLTPEQLEDYR